MKAFGIRHKMKGDFVDDPKKFMKKENFALVKGEKVPLSQIKTVCKMEKPRGTGKSPAITCTFCDETLINYTEFKKHVLRNYWNSTKRIIRQDADRKYRCKIC